MFNRLTVARIEASFAAIVILTFCSLSLGVATVFALTGTRIYMSYACLNGVNGYPSDTLVGKTCGYVGDLEKSYSTADAMGFTLLRDIAPMGTILTFFIGWASWLFTLAFTIPQSICAWDFFLTTFTRHTTTERSLIYTWRHQAIQNTIIFVELLVTIGLTVVVLASNPGAGYGLDTFVNLMIKVLIGRIFCAFFVEIYFHEQLISIFASGQRLNLPSEYQEKFEKEFRLGQTGEKLDSGKKPILV